MSSAPRTARTTDRRERIGRYVDALPDLVPLAVGAYSVVAMVLLLLGAYRPVPALALGAIAIVLVVALARPRGASLDRPGGVAADRSEEATAHRPDRRPLALLGLLVLAAAVVNVVFAAEYLFNFRDPATYGIVGRWLVDHGSPLLTYDNAIFGHAEGVDPGSLGFGVVADRTAVWAQGNHLLPALLAVPGWFFGGDAVLWANPVLGALSLVSVYALGRRIVGDWWALLPPYALAASMPFLAFVRATYSEPITMLLLIGGLALVCRALDTGRTIDMALAGMTLGASAMARVDSYAALLAVPVAAAFWLVGSDRAGRRHDAARAGALLGGVVLPMPLAVLDLRMYSPGYWADRLPETRLLFLAGAGLLVLGAVAVAVAWATPLSRWVSARRRPLALVVAAAVAVGFLVLAARPLWYVARHASEDMVGDIGAVQAGLGLPVDPTRTYDELSVSWLSWYFGWPTVALGLAGLVIVTWRVVRHGDRRLVLPLGTVLVLAALYFTRVLIYPDQVWAMRRLLPVVVPGVLIGAAVSLAASWSLPARRFVSRTRQRAALLVLVATALAVPTVVSLPLSPVVEYGGQRAEVQAICDHLPPDAALLGVDVDGARAGYLQTFRVFCDVPASGLVQPGPTKLAPIAAAAAARGHQLYVVTATPEDLEWEQPPAPTTEVVITKWNETLLSPPNVGIRFDRALYLGRVTPAGLAQPVPAR